MAARDTQIGGEHYTSLAIQPWEALEVWLSREQFEGYLLGTALNYLARSDHKADRLEDWKKARHTLDKLIEIGSVAIPRGGLADRLREDFPGKFGSP